MPSPKQKKVIKAWILAGYFDGLPFEEGNAMVFSKNPNLPKIKNYVQVEISLTKPKK